MNLQEVLLELNNERCSLEVKRLLCDATNWKNLKKGMTNHSYIFDTSGQKYILRIPGEGTDKLINRRQELEVYKAISGQGFCDEPVFIDGESGIKITRYLVDAKTCNSYNGDEVKECMRLLKRLHGMNLQVNHTFDLFGQIEFYERLRRRKSTYPDYFETKEKIFSLRHFIDAQEKHWCLSHIDAICDNFLFYGNHLQLIDWEYAGMQDPHIDIAMFCVYNNYSREQIDKLIDIYFEGKCERSTRRKIYCYISACGLLWSNWCEYKHQFGVKFGEYAKRQYQYAKDYCQV